MATAGCAASTSVTTIGSAAEPRRTITEPSARRASMNETTSLRRRRRRDRRLEGARRPLLQEGPRGGGVRRPVAQHERRGAESLLGQDPDRHRPPGLSDVHRLVHQRLVGRQLIVGAVGEAGDRFVERCLDPGLASPGLSPPRLDLERPMEVLDRLIALLEAAEGHDPQRDERARPDRMQREARPVRDLERLVEELHRRLELADVGRRRRPCDSAE